MYKSKNTPLAEAPHLLFGDSGHQLVTFSLRSEAAQSPPTSSRCLARAEHQEPAAGSKSLESRHPSSSPPYPRGLRPPCRKFPPGTTWFGPPDVFQALGRGPRRPLAGWLTVRTSCGVHLTPGHGVQERFGTVHSGNWSSLCRWCHCCLGVWEQAEISTSYLFENRILSQTSNLLQWNISNVISV